MSRTVYTIANVLHSLMILKEKIPSKEWGETPLPIIAAPGWWMNEVREELGVEEGFEPGQIHGCAIVRNDDIDEPCLIDHDGKVYPIVPQWMRAPAADTDGGEA